MNGVNIADNVFIPCVSVCDSVCLSADDRDDSTCSSKMCKTMDFKLDMHVPRISPESRHESLTFFRQGSVAMVTRPPKFLGIWALNANGSKRAKTVE